MPSADWRDIQGYYPWPEGNWPEPCCVCGSTDKIGLEPRFNYPVCEEHSKLSPVQINERRTDGQ